jgi:hypothetical protein
MTITLSGSGFINATAPRYSIVGSFALQTDVVPQSRMPRFALIEDGDGAFLVNRADLITSWLGRPLIGSYQVVVRGTTDSGMTEIGTFSIDITDQATPIVEPASGPAVASNAFETTDAPSSERGQGHELT